MLRSNRRLISAVDVVVAVVVGLTGISAAGQEAKVTFAEIPEND